MNTPTKFEKEMQRTLDILIKNFRAQVPDNNGSRNVELEIYLNDVDAYDPENIHPCVFCDIVRSFKKEDIKIDEYDHDSVLSNSREYGDRHTPFCSVSVPANFEEIYEKRKRKTAGVIERVENKLKLSSQKITFDDNKAEISADDRPCSLPAFKNEHYFCRVMFGYPADELVDWSVVYEKMTASEPANEKKGLRTVQDTMYAINNRIKAVLNTENELFSWQNKCIKRNF
jgi:hypothetical protein